jgi:hypothetical protein
MVQAAIGRVVVVIAVVVVELVVLGAGQGVVVVTGGNPAQLPFWHVSTDVMDSPSSRARADCC